MIFATVGVAVFLLALSCFRFTAACALGSSFAGVFSYWGIASGCFIDFAIGGDMYIWDPAILATCFLFWSLK